MKQRLLLIALVALSNAYATPSFDAPKTESSEIAGATVERARAQLPRAAYRVILTEQGDLAWIESSGDTPIIYTKEPKTSWGRRFKVGVYGILPIEGQL